LADTGKEYATVDADVLLLTGARSPAYFGIALDELAAVLPHSTRRTFPKLDHSGPENDGDPSAVGESLRAFFG
jgi:hypothetical protein